MKENLLAKKAMALDIKPLLCPMCIFACYNDIELEQHFQIHSNENSINNIVISQVKSDVPETFYACQVCDFMSAGEEQLESHYKNKHPMNNNSQEIVTKTTMPSQSLSNNKIDSSFGELPVMKPVSETIPVVSGPLYACAFCGLYGSSLESVQFHYQSQHLDIFKTFLLQEGIIRPTKNQPILSMEQINKMIQTQPSRFPTIRPAIPPEIRNVYIPVSHPMTKMHSSSNISFRTIVPNLSISPSSQTSLSQHDKDVQCVKSPESVPSFEISDPKLINVNFSGLCNIKMNSLESAYNLMAMNQENSQTANKMLNQCIIPNNLKKFDLKNDNQNTILEKEHIQTNYTGNCNTTESQNKVDITVPITNIKNELNDQQEDIQIATEPTPNSDAADKDSLKHSVNVELIYDKKKLINCPDILFSCDACGYVDKKIKFMKAHLRENHEQGSWSAMEVKFFHSEEIKDDVGNSIQNVPYKSSQESGYREVGFLCQSCSFHTHSHIIISRHNIYVHKKKGSYLYVEIRNLLLNESLKNNVKILESVLPSNRKNTRNSLDNSAPKCQDCSKDFLSLVELKRHLITTNHILHCHFCSFFTKIPNALSHHNYRKHANTLPKSLEKKAHKCPHCPYISPLYFKIINHIRLQHKDGHKYQCDSCYKTFATIVQFDNHCRVHKQLRPFPCKHCSYGARNESLLKRHIRNHHSFEKSVQCPFCNFLSATRYSIIPHLKNKHATWIQGIATIIRLVMKDTPVIHQKNSDISSILVSSSITKDTEVPKETKTECFVELNDGFDSDDFFSSDDMTEEDNEIETKIKR